MYLDPSYHNGVIESPSLTQVAANIYSAGFWTEEFCEELIKLVKYKNIKKEDIEYNDMIPADDTPINHISSTLFHDYCKHYKQWIFPLLKEVFCLPHPPESWFLGWQQPNIARFSPEGTSSIFPHFDFGVISHSIKLNDNFKGGLLKFNLQNYDNGVLPIGHMLIWPSGITHMHEVTKVEQGEKYSFVNWSLMPNYMGKNQIRLNEIS